MENKEKIIEAIVEVVFDELKEHMTKEDPTIYMSGNGRNFDFIGGNDQGQGYKAVSNAEAIAKIRETVIKDYEKEGKVILYTCRDNAEVCIEEMQKEWVKEWFGKDSKGYPVNMQEICYWDQGTKKHTTLKDIVFIGYD